MALAALLLNNYRKKQRDSDAAPLKRIYDGEVKTNRTREAELRHAISQLKKTKIVRPEIVSQVEQYADENVTTNELSNLLATLSARQFELRQHMGKLDTPDSYIVLALESIAVVLTYLNQDEEDILAILLSE